MGRIITTPAQMSNQEIEGNTELLLDFKNCLFRWDVIGKDELRQGTDMDDKVGMLISHIVELSTEEVAL